MSGAAEVLAAFRARGWMLATAESCTGGGIAAALTDVAGSSDVVDRGFVTYSNRAKEQMLGVPGALITQHGAVSEPVALAMASGALERSDAHVTVAVTGIAGPGGGSAEKPEGLVWFGLAVRGGPVRAFAHKFGAIGRAEVRRKTVNEALSTLLSTTR